MPQKLDVEIEVHEQQALDDLKAGQKVLILETDGIWTCCREDERLIGHLPREAAVDRQLRSSAAFAAVIRSVKRVPGESNAVGSAQIRISFPVAEHAGHTPTLVQADVPAEDTAGFTLTTSELERLAFDKEFRTVLMDARLQQMLHKIDGAVNREQALKQALETSQFRDFADQMLHIMKPGEYACQDVGPTS